MPRHARTPKALRLGLATVLTLALVGPLVSVAQAAESDPVPALVAGDGTSAPQLVTGLADPAAGDPVAASRAYLAAHQDRYRIDVRQLTVLDTQSTSGGGHTVRFQQTHGGIPVLGAQYLVHLTGEGAGQRVVSVGGKYFTDLAAPTTATAPAEVLRALALGALKGARAGAAAEDRGQVVLPAGAGRLARHFTVTGTDQATGHRQAREVYLDAATGAVALAYDTVARVPTPAAARAASAPAGGGAVPDTATAPDAHGKTVSVKVGRLPDGNYEFTDLTHSSPITTYDAAGADQSVGIPAGSKPVSSPSRAFPASAGTSGATDAQLNAGLVYDFYHDRLGRDGLDGKGGAITSVVNVSDGGDPYLNAFWDGQKMVYGNGDAAHFPFSVALDVAGHEMTHGVIQHTADFVDYGQPGALNEALADYFGNAIEVTARGVSMTDPQAALLGESLCRTGTPETCATRRMDDHRTMAEDYLGVGADVDSGGAHLNSTIVSGALWDIRRTLDPLTADRVVYRALSGYLTPLDDFVAARAAVLAAGQELGLTRAQLKSVAAAFDAHGIKAGWQKRIGVDSRLLLGDVSASVAPAVADGRWVMANVAGGKGNSAVYTGSTAAAGTPLKLSPDDGRTHNSPATDGTTAAWLAVGTDAQGKWGMSVLAAPTAGGPVRTLFSSANQEPGGIQVSGGDVAFTVTDFATGHKRVQLSRAGGPAVELPLPDGHRPEGLTFKNGLLGWVESWAAGAGQVYAPTVYSVATGKVTARYVLGNADGSGKVMAESTLLAGGRLLWTERQLDGEHRASVRSGAVDGSGTTSLLAADSPLATQLNSLVASDRAVTLVVGSTTKPTAGWSNAALPKLWQLPITGGAPVRVSCNRGSQEAPAAAQGSKLLWLDSTAGRTDLVTRTKAAGTC
ncbi:hypothetical protein CFP65_6090 [Kitasatospora sp. MMS16-BH015]|uniref:M4 family metallopeptidase n=1 Tax=Kitasatospora sp. MMS16-BH015 TaxID=2018025 RepID=UPI000CA22367|nr:M4 family metallopeptidase [Kitasatospora sp. MMS16-BH015]AUG80759.1 hypothetical protein CFP65_6090 [Kitasatospora sp. MMS16-BH015]